MSKYISEKVNKLSSIGMMKLIPRSYKPFSEVISLRRGLCVNSVKGWLALYSSKDYLQEPRWRVKPYIQEVKPDIAFWVFALDIRGIVIIPINIIEVFCVENGISKTPSGQWKLGIQEIDGRYYLFSTKSMYDVTDCFLPSSFRIESNS